MTEDITLQNIYQDEDIYANLSDKELKDLYEDLEAGFLNEGRIKLGISVPTGNDRIWICRKRFDPSIPN